MKEKVIRKNITENVIEKFEFDVNGFEFLIKNFGEADIYVSSEATNEKSKMSKIPAKCGEVWLINKNSAFDNFSDSVYVLSEGSGEVEVQCLKF